MLSVFWAVKGGSGTTVVAASVAVAGRRPALLVDLAGDLPAVLGVPEPDGPGVTDWLASTAPPDRLSDLVVAAGNELELLPRGTSDAEPAAERWQQLAEWLVAHDRHVIVDAGTWLRPRDQRREAAVVDAADERVLVTRLCYLSLWRAARLAVNPTGVVVVSEPGRLLGADDVAASVGAPVLTELLVDPKVARVVDAGLLMGRLPAGYRRGLQWAA